MCYRFDKPIEGRDKSQKEGREYFYIKVKTLKIDLRTYQRPYYEM